MEKVIKNKRGFELVTNCSSGYKISSEKFLHYFYIIYYIYYIYLTNFNDVIYSGVWVIPKITAANLCKPIHDILNYSISICLFESRKCWKEGEKLQKFEYLENEKIFLDEIKNIFHSFWRAIIWWKNKKLIKNSGHKLLTI